MRSTPWFTAVPPPRPTAGGRMGWAPSRCGRGGSACQGWATRGQAVKGRHCRVRLGAQRPGDLLVTADTSRRLPHSLCCTFAWVEQPRRSLGLAAWAVTTASWGWLARKGTEIKPQRDISVGVANKGGMVQSRGSPCHSPLAPRKAGRQGRAGPSWGRELQLNIRSAGCLAGWKSLLIGTLGGGSGGKRGGSHCADELSWEQLASCCQF